MTALRSNLVPSEVDWIGDVPSDWQVLRVKRLFRIEKKIIGHEGPDVLSVTQQGLKVKDLEASQGQFAADYSKYQIVEPGDFVANHMDLLTGFADVASQFGVTSPDYRVFRPVDPENMEPAFFNRVQQHCYSARIFYPFGQGASHFGRWRLPTDEFLNFFFPVPPLPEQRAIAGFLDRETAKIDALVEEQRRLIALLKEKRQAVISHAVTKGLDPAAPMKPSGIDWLGDIPAHWEVVALRRLVNPGRKVTYGIVQPGEPDPEGRFMVRGQDYSRGWAPEETVFRVSQAIEEPYKRARLSEGDIVITIVGAGTGNTAVVPSRFSGANITQTTARIAPDREKITSEYLHLATQSDVGRKQVQLYQKGAAQPGLNLEHLVSFRFPVPPLGEQTEIVISVGAQTSALNDLTAEAERAITLLQERRAALISAAVTGKIDVRDTMTDETEAA